MNLIDANLLIYATSEDIPQHAAASRWLTEQLEGTTRVGVPWLSLFAFVRIMTNRRLHERPLTADEAWTRVEALLALPVTWIPEPTHAHATVVARLCRRHQATGGLVMDAHLAALAIEHGLTVCSTDTDFARFTPEVRWLNPLV